MQQSPQKQYLHQVWLQCMKMNNCSTQQASSFLQSINNILNFPVTQSGQTILMVACSIGSFNIVLEAIKKGAKTSIKDVLGRTALHYAASVGVSQIFELLVNNGASPLEETIGSETPLTKACLFSQGDIIQWYLNNCLAAFEMKDRMGKTPLEVLKVNGQYLYEQVREVYNQLIQQ